MHEREPANNDELTIDSRTGRLFYSSNDQESKILSDIKSIPAKQIKYFCKCESLGVNMNKDIRVALSFFDHRKTSCYHNRKKKIIRNIKIKLATRAYKV